MDEDVNAQIVQAKSFSVRLFLLLCYLTAASRNKLTRN